LFFRDCIFWSKTPKVQKPLSPKTFYSNIRFGTMPFGPNHIVQNHKLLNLSHNSTKFNHFRFLEFIAFRFKKSLAIQKFSERMFIFTLNKILYVMIIVPKIFGLSCLLDQRVLDESVFGPNGRWTKNFWTKRYSPVFPSVFFNKCRVGWGELLVSYIALSL
jgi:hypothetical protein